MVSIDFLILDAPEAEAARRFYSAMGLEKCVQLRAAAAPTGGFRGYTLSLITAQPENVDSFTSGALEAGATSLKPAAKSLWGYGSVLRAPDGTILTIASSAKKDTAPASQKVDDVVLQLGVADVAVSKDFYVEHGFSVSKSYGRKYVEFATGTIQLTLNARRSLAKTVGTSADGTGSHGLTIATDAGPFTDPDGFVAERPVKVP